MMTVLNPEREATDAPDSRNLGRPANGHGNGHGHGNGKGTGHGGGSQGPGGPGREEPESDVPARYLRQRRSFWPFLLDLGVALGLFGWIITGRFLIVIGAVLFVVALIGWIREARAEYAALRD
jgi:hypothetical protein